MNIRTSLIASVSLFATLALPLQSTMAQSDQQCSLKTITQALNNLGCAVPGAYISPDSVVASIKATCAPTAGTETCHACFTKGGAKIGPALKALVKAQMLAKPTLSQFRVALVAAEEATCVSQATPVPNNQDDSRDTDPPPTNGQSGLGGAQGGGRDDSGGAKPEKPQKPEKPERPERRR